MTKISKEYLKNDSFPERGGERAYYDYQNRSRRYRNRYDGYSPKYEYDNRYTEHNTYRDRDNDGRYNE